MRDRVAALKAGLDWEMPGPQDRRVKASWKRFFPENWEMMDQAVELAQVTAVIEGWMMGQAGGIAIADVLTEKGNPSGKLAETFPLKLSDTPSPLNWPGGAGEERYGNESAIGMDLMDMII